MSDTPSPLDAQEVADSAYKSEVRRQFIEYMASPDPDKCDLLGIEKGERGVYVSQPTLEKFALKHGVASRTLRRWKSQPDFIKAVDIKRKERGIEWTPNVLAALYRRCVKYGMAYDVETYLAYFEGWNKTQSVKLQTEKVDADDLRALAALLPPEKQEQFNELITTLITEAESARVVA